MSKPKQNPNILPAIQDNSQPIATSKRDSREDDFIRLMFMGLSVPEAGLKAGYSQSYCSSAIYQKFNSPSFQDKVRDYAIANNGRSIPKVCKLYEKALDRLDKQVDSGDLDGLAKLKHITTHVLTIGKILQPEHGMTVNLVNVESLQAIVNGKFVHGSEHNEDK